MRERNPEEKTAKGGGGEWFVFSFRSFLAIAVGIVLFVLYVKILLFGNNSLTVLRSLEAEKAKLLQERSALREANQLLQKHYFELLQITGG